MNQKIKIIAPSKDAFQNMDWFLKLLPQKKTCQNTDELKKLLPQKCIPKLFFLILYTVKKVIILIIQVYV